MADPRMFDTPVTVGFEEALRALGSLLADVPEAAKPFAETYENPHLPGSPASLLEAVSVDNQVRAEHGERVLMLALTKVTAAQQRRIEEMEERLALKPGKPPASSAAPARPKAAAAKK
jgi:hypothetical protein